MAGGQANLEPDLSIGYMYAQLVDDYMGIIRVGLGSIANI